MAASNKPASIEHLEAESAGLGAAERVVHQNESACMLHGERDRAGLAGVDAGEPPRFERSGRDADPTVAHRGVELLRSGQSAARRDFVLDEPRDGHRAEELAQHREHAG